MELSVAIQKVLPDFTLEVSFNTGKDTLGILGASGSGKSMTLRCISGLDTPTRGRIILNGRVLFDSERGINLPSKDRNVGFLFQNYALFPHMTVAQNIAFGLRGLPKKEQARRVEEKLFMVKLEGLEARYPYQLSGGQQQRVALARALAVEPEALLLDEPFSALDNHLRSYMEKQLIETLATYNGVTLFVTHNLEEAYRVSQELLILAAGKAAAYGPKASIFQSPPTYSAAELTGCKNLSRAKAIGPNQIEALDWGCSLYLNQAIPPDLTHVGIRAHNLSIVDDPILENTYPCWIVRTSESPYRKTLHLCLERPSATSSSEHLQAEISNELWAACQDRPFPWLIRLNPEHLFITTGLS